MTPQPIYTSAGIRAVEADFLATADPPLMERAGAAAADIASGLLAGRSGKTLILAGPGNNGGDGAVVARLLHAAGVPVTVVFAGDPARLPSDARNAFEALQAGGAEVVARPPEGDEPPALAVDALFGIGLARPLDGRYAEWVRWLNRRRCPVLAIDIPSGLDADTGGVLGAAVRATHTVTFIALKPGLLTRDGPDHCGRITVHELDLPLARAAAPEGYTNAPGLFAAQTKPRLRNSHKGLMGDAGIIGGAAGMVGAAILAGRAALKLGAGRMFVGLLAPEAPAHDVQQPELMLRAPRSVLDLATVLAVGPGLGQSEAARALLAEAVVREVPLVLDADALNLVAAHSVLARWVARRAAPTLITPHPAEAARLLGRDTAAVQANRIAAALDLARRFNSLTVLKGCGSVLAAPDGRWWINTNGNPGMASAGMGDVLSGIACALLAQHWPAVAALQGAVYLHGAAADALVGQDVGPIGLAAGELIEPARRLLNRLCCGAGAADQA